MKIQVIACDVCRQAPATSYEIKTSDDRGVSVDLCSVHNGAVEALILDFGPQGALTAEGEAAVEEEAELAPVKPIGKATAKKATTAKKAATAKKATQSRRRAPKIVSLAEIEASKKA